VLIVQLRALRADGTITSVFPRLAELCKNETAPLSRSFAKEVLIPAGLISARTKNHAASGKPRALWLRIPMFNDQSRSLNLSNCVALVLFEALRQQGFQGEIR
jgi:tRNA(Leu) C34 or U34 (ribose-2'-O)-methylase TrmL